MKKLNGKTLRIAAIQMVSKVGANKENLVQAHRMLKTAIEHDVQMVIFPELMPSGYTSHLRSGRELSLQMVLRLTGSGKPLLNLGFI